MPIHILHLAGHECDTDLCKGCSSSVVLKEHSGGTLPCNNMKLRLRQHKRIAMGKSDVQGWGSFLLVSSLPSSCGRVPSVVVYIWLPPQARD